MLKSVWFLKLFLRGQDSHEQIQKTNKLASRRGFGVTLGSLSSHFGVILGSLGLLWVYESYFGVILVRFHEIRIFPIYFNDFIKVWGEFWIDLGLHWGHFW